MVYEHISKFAEENMKIEIDEKSGFCFGVVNAINLAEKTLEKKSTLYCLGDIVHNNKEVERLAVKGLVSIDRDQFKTLKNTTVLIRAHGEPPETYAIANKNNITLIDGTCPVVLKLQKRITEKNKDKKAQIVIFGKKGHAEIIGLEGQTNNTAIIVESLADIKRIDFGRPVYLFAQTTRNKDRYKELALEIEKRIKQKLGNIKQFRCTNSICGQVSNRSPHLREFCKNHEVILFVSGKKSSNGKVLFLVCKETNNRAYFISEPEEIQKEWLKNTKTLGICGATSTPRWLMEEVADYVRNLCNS